jgi:hypothetical protein
MAYFPVADRIDPLLLVFTEIKTSTKLFSNCTIWTMMQVCKCMTSLACRWVLPTLPAASAAVARRPSAGSASPSPPPSLPPSTSPSSSYLRVCRPPRCCHPAVWIGYSAEPPSDTGCGNAAPSSLRPRRRREGYNQRIYIVRIPGTGRDDLNRAHWDWFFII